MNVDSSHRFPFTDQMPRGEQSRFRISLWPDHPTGPLERPYVWHIRHEGDWSLPLDGEEITGEFRDVPDELYLRGVRDVDVMDRDQVQNFTSEWGPLSRPAVESANDLLTPGVVPMDITADVDLAAATRPHHFAVHWREQAALLAAVQNAATISGAYVRHDGADGFGAGLRLVGDVPGRPWATPQDCTVAGQPPGRLGLDWESALLYWLSGILDAALREFHVRLLWMPPGGVKSRTGWMNAVRPSLYSVLMLQLAQHIAEGSAFHVCQSETCSRLFVRQQGRAEFGQHRSSGVKYCTVSCARAQGNREYRRRKKGQN